MTKTQKITKVAMIAGLYAALTLAIPILSYGIVQFRISEALTILPVFTTTAIPGLAIGCAIANLIGFFIGANPVGLIDALFGSAASLIAAVLTYIISKKIKGFSRYVLIPLPAILINALVVGFEITYFFMGTTEFSVMLINAGTVLVGQTVICYGLGVPLLILIEKNKFLQKIIK